MSFFVAELWTNFGTATQLETQEGRRLDRELRDRGYTGRYDAVRRALPSSRRLSFAVARRPDCRTDEERLFVERLRAAGGAVQAAAELGERFAAGVRDRSADGLDGWLAAADASGIPEFAGLARSMRQDRAAVWAGVTRAWSNGPVEGHVHRLTLIKRARYGRAGFPLLKARVRHGG